MAAQREDVAIRLLQLALDALVVDETLDLADSQRPPPPGANRRLFETGRLRRTSASAATTVLARRATSHMAANSPVLGDARVGNQVVVELDYQFGVVQQRFQPGEQGVRLTDSAVAIKTHPAVDTELGQNAAQRPDLPSSIVPPASRMAARFQREFDTHSRPVLGSVVLHLADQQRRQAAPHQNYRAFRWAPPVR